MFFPFFLYPLFKPMVNWCPVCWCECIDLFRSRWVWCTALNSTVRQGDHLFLEILLKICSVAELLQLFSTLAKKIGITQCISMTSQLKEWALMFSLPFINTSMTCLKFRIIEQHDPFSKRFDSSWPTVTEYTCRHPTLVNSFVAGDIIHFNITSNNLIGGQAFNSILYCLFGQEVYNDVLVLGVGQRRQIISQSVQNPVCWNVNFKVITNQ